MSYNHTSHEAQITLDPKTTRVIDVSKRVYNVRQLRR